MLPACASGPLECPPPSKVEVPVREPIDAELITDCRPEGMPADGPLRFRDIEHYTLSLEVALDCARDKLKKLRENEAMRAT